MVEGPGWGWGVLTSCPVGGGVGDGDGENLRTQNGVQRLRGREEAVGMTGGGGQANTRLKERFFSGRCKC